LGKLLSYYIQSDGLGECIGFYDDFNEKGNQIGDLYIQGKISDLMKDFEKGVFDQVLICIGYKHFNFRAQIFDRLKEWKIPLFMLKHSSSYVDPSATVKEGCVLFPRSCIDAGVVLEENVLINSGSVIAHDSIIRRHSFVAPGVSIAGFVNIGER